MIDVFLALSWQTALHWLFRLHPNHIGTVHIFEKRFIGRFFAW